MPNKNYIAGRNFEYRVKKYLEKLGYYVLRSYGSKGTFDLIAIPAANPPAHAIWFVHTHLSLMIQCKKRDYVHPEELKNLEAAAKKYRAVCMVATNDKSRKLIFKEISWLRK